MRSVDAVSDVGVPQTTVIVVLGCRVLPSGEPSVTLVRRIEHAVELWRHRGVGLILCSGGRRWHGVPEATVMRERALLAGVTPESVICELCSLNTRQNAEFSWKILAKRGVNTVTVVTSDWHMPRALLAFRRVGFQASPGAVLTPASNDLGARIRTLREALRLMWDRMTSILEAEWRTFR